MGRRLVLVAVYLVVSFVVSFISLGGGHGTEAPFMVFYGWATVRVPFSVPFGPVFGILYLLGYIALLFSINTVAARIRYALLRPVAMYVHTVGVLIALGGVDESPNHMDVDLCILSAFIVLGYLFWDLVLARRAVQVSKESVPER